ncbi:MAG TPA: tetratricopeptide repeat protein [Candidatus Eisenbacteria bacterium]|nr:tetratricopeptide repeat protein [Candidatus Eisenbacteria bacterium]
MSDPCLRFILFGVFLIAMPRQSAALEPAEDAFRRGNQLYEAGDYAAAMEAYEAILNRGLAAPELEYNLGNAALKAGRIGLAVLHYRRALRLRPNYENAWVNLNYARSLTQDLKPEDSASKRPGWEAKLRLGPERAAFLLWLSALVLAGVASWRRLATGAPPWLGGVQWVAAGVMLLLVAALLFERSQARGGREGVVLAEETEVRVGPSPDQTVSFRLHQGTEVDILRSVPGWIDVKVSSELEGWVPENTLEPI